MVVESAGRRILVDAGFSARETVRRLRLGGLDPRRLDAIVLTHEHQDHARGAELLSRRFKLPVYASEGSWEARGLRRIERRFAFRPGDRIELRGFEVETFSVSHDARQPVGLVVENRDGLRLGVAADLGTATAEVRAALSALDLLVLESNHDEDLLMRGPYPWSLKERVRSSRGHLSNLAAAELIESVISERLSDVVLYHLSTTNNLPDLAHDAVAGTLRRLGAEVAVTLTQQNEPTGWLEVAAAS